MKECPECGKITYFDSAERCIYCGHRYNVTRRITSGDRPYDGNAGETRTETRPRGGEAIEKRIERLEAEAAGSRAAAESAVRLLREAGSGSERTQEAERRTAEAEEKLRAESKRAAKSDEALKKTQERLDAAEKMLRRMQERLDAADERERKAAEEAARAEKAARDSREEERKLPGAETGSAFLSRAEPSAQEPEKKPEPAEDPYASLPETKEGEESIFDGMLGDDGFSEFGLESTGGYSREELNGSEAEEEADEEKKEPEEEKSSEKGREKKKDGESRKGKKKKGTGIEVLFFVLSMFFPLGLILCIVSLVRKKGDRAVLCAEGMLLGVALVAAVLMLSERMGWEDVPVITWTEEAFARLGAWIADLIS